MKLTDNQCRQAKPREKPWNLTDGLGLFLLVKPNGSKLWRQDYAFDGRRLTASFGPYPDTGLARARDLRDELKQKIRDGINPVEKPTDSRPTFEQIAREWFKVNQGKWEPSYSARFWARIEGDIFPAIGSKPIADIKPPMVLAALRPIEEREAARRAV
jgi:hypothetical protein